MMKVVLLAVLLAFVEIEARLVPPYKEECIEELYPPDPKRKVPTYVINLDEAPEKRWQKPAADKAKELKALFDVMKSLSTPFFNGTFVKAVDNILPFVGNILPYPFNEELNGIAKASGVPLGEVTLLNIFYEIFSACTSIVAQDKNGTLYHGRNLDFGIFMGWDYKKHTWKIPEVLRPLVANFDFKRSGKTVFKSVNFIGYVGILTAVKPQRFTLTMNERFQLDGGYVGIAKWLFGIGKGHWMGFLTREVMENATTFDEARDMLNKTELMAPAYFILGGNRTGQAAIITRGRTDTNVLELGDWSRKWYLLQTNYDHWEKPMLFDDRRTPGMACMDKQGRNVSASIHGIFNVLSSQPMLNKLTTYVALMQVDSGTLQTYLQHCKEPCWGW